MKIIKIIIVVEKINKMQIKKIKIIKKVINKTVLITMQNKNRLKPINLRKKKI